MASRRMRPGRSYLSLWLTLGLFAGIAAAEPPSYEAVKAAWRPSELQLLDRHGELLQELRADVHGRRTDWTPLDAVSPALIAAVLHAEDRRFLEHAGVDWLAAGKAALTNLWRERPRGASTLTMQLAALLDDGLRSRGQRRGLSEKWRQMQAAQALERHWSKGQVLEAYLNLIPLRGELIGVDAAARALFDKRPAGLTAAESLILAALIRAPNAPPEAVAGRVCALARDFPLATPDCKALRRLTLNTLSGRTPILPAADTAPHLARRLLAETTSRAKGGRLRTTLDAGLQREVRAILHEQLQRLAARNVQDAAALVLDNASGEVLAYASVSAAGAASPEIDGVQAPRQAGSSLKPFLYALLLDRRTLTAASPLEDRPLAIATAGGQYVPRNYDLDHKGWVSLREALAGSLNIPAVRALQLAGLEPYATLLSELGFAGLTEAADFYGLSLALGSLDVRLWELTNAYRTLANGGISSPLRLTHSGKAAPARRVFSPEAAWLVGDILADRQARALTFGLENPLATRHWTAVKTGTSKDMRDNWCVGWSTRYTVGVWVGNHDGAPMQGVSGVSGAAPAWAAIMTRLHADLPSAAPPPPKGLVRLRIQIDTEKRAIEEWFLRGTAPEERRWRPALPRPVILAPADGGLYASDPDIPPSARLMRFEAAHAPPGSRWRLDDNPDTPDEWLPTPGPHRLQLVDRDGRELAAVRFEVR